ncbi:MAG: RsmB/NOP family class I SAM-dependent RNA methyltransferase [Arhodomonas sp.]|nr:RsmB/NOP family class I SAM-dependent RNA methyltransferase [Arhodomonas sp.]
MAQGDAVGAAVDAVYRRYRGVVGDWDAFRASLERPLAPTVWPHPRRISRAALGALLAEQGIVASPLPWHPSALVLPAGTGTGGHWGFYAGLYQSQEAVAMVPVMLLDPRPGERVLDLCAAPGNKTAQIALAMANRGTVHANEAQRGRLSALQATIKRLGLMNVTVTLGPGQDLALANGPFDRVLVDAPCSGEGIWRKLVGEAPPRGFHVADEGMRARLVRRQRQLLERAVRLTRRGGRIVYSTCTLAPRRTRRWWTRYSAPAPGSSGCGPRRWTVSAHRRGSRTGRGCGSIPRWRAASASGPTRTTPAGSSWPYWRRSMGRHRRETCGPRRRPMPTRWRGWRTPMGCPPRPSRASPR